MSRIRRWLGLGPEIEGDGDGALRRRVMMLAWPAMLQGLLITSIQVIDTYIVSMLSDEALAAVGTASQLIFVLLILLIGVEVGGSVLVAHAVGARDRREANRVARQTIVVGLILAMPLTAIGYGLRHELIGLFGLEPAVEALTLEYWSVIAFSVAVLMLVFVLSGLLRGSGDTRTPMIASGIATVTNAFFAYVLVFGHLGFPEMGVAGSALGSTIGWSTEVIFMLWVLQRGDRPVSLIGRRGWWPRWETVKGIARIGAPVSGEETSWSFGLALLTGIVAILGTEALAAHRIVFNALTLSFMPGLGLAMATTALVGQAVGGRDPETARRVTAIGGQYAATWMGMIGVIYFVAAEPIVRVFSSDPEVISAGAWALRALAVTQPFWGLLLAFSGAMRGTGKSVYPMLVNSFMVWSAVGLAFVAVSAGLGLGAVWFAFAVVAPVPVWLLWKRLGREPLLTSGHPDILDPGPRPMSAPGAAIYTPDID
ncbi:MAG: MATE family efflux transporter [Chloroflexota bacterium]